MQGYFYAPNRGLLEFNMIANRRQSPSPSAPARVGRYIAKTNELIGLVKIEPEFPSLGNHSIKLSMMTFRAGWNMAGFRQVHRFSTIFTA